MAVDNMTELRKRIPGGKYALARAIAERAKQLQNGALPLTEVKIPNPITVAIDEVVQGKVTFDFKDSEDIAKEAAAEELLAADPEFLEAASEEAPGGVSEEAPSDDDTTEIP